MGDGGPALGRSIPSLCLEADELLDFPNPSKREEDARYLLAATGELNGSMELNVLHLLPLTKEEWQFASENGSYALLERLGPDLPIPYGWPPLGATAPRP